MLPTPSTSHVSFTTVYEPAEDSYLLLDTLSSPTETTWLQNRFNSAQKSHLEPSVDSAPLVLEVGTGSGVILAFVTANAASIFGTRDVLTLGVDVNENACLATKETVRIAVDERHQRHHRQQHFELRDSEVTKDESRNHTHADEKAALKIACVTADLCSPIRDGTVDVVIFNPPYVPTSEMPLPPEPVPTSSAVNSLPTTTAPPSRSDESNLLALSYAGGKDGMETTNRLIQDLPRLLTPDRGVAYILLCARNRMQDVESLVRGWDGGRWEFEIVGDSGGKAGWERLKVVKIWKRAGGYA